MNQIQQYIEQAEKLDKEGSLREAAEIYEKAVDLAKKDVTLSQLAIRLYHKLGCIYSVMLQYTPARTCFDAAEDLQKQNPGLEIGKEDTILNLLDLGYFYCVAGEFSLARDCYRKAMKIVQELGPHHTLTARVYYDYGQSFTEEGQFDKAIIELKKALSIYEELPDADPSEIGIMKYRIGQAYYYNEEPEEALGYCAAAVDAIKEEYGEGDVRTAILTDFMMDVKKMLEGKQLLAEGKDYLEKHDDRQAFDCLKKAAALNIADAICLVGDCYRCGIGVEKDSAMAVKYYEQGADMEHTESILQLANCLYKGEGVAVNLELSAEYMLEAAEAGNQSAMYAIAIRYLEGQGVAKDEEQANYWLNRARSMTQPFVV